jgi:hypothetical protein
MRLRPNIDRRGRLARFAVGLLLGVAAAACARSGAGWGLPAAVLLGTAALFALFESAAGWCAARACGIRTRI